MNLATLLDQRDGLDPDAWLASLPERKRIEATFHDEWRDPARATDHAVTQTNTKFYSVRGASESYTDHWIARNAPSAVFLDYCCGEGKKTVMAAQCNAALAIGMDLSPQSIALGRARAGDLPNVRFVVGDCENTGLPDHSVDRILAYGVLHHLDLSVAFPEIKRILRPGGVLHAHEPLAYNPVIALYRRLTPSLRTEWERHHILSLRTLRYASQFFTVRDVRFWHIIGPAATLLRSTPYFGAAVRVADRIDRALTRLPGIRLMAWSFSFELVA